MKNVRSKTIYDYSSSSSSESPSGTEEEGEEDAKSTSRWRGDYGAVTFGWDRESKGRVITMEKWGEEEEEEKEEEEGKEEEEEEAVSVTREETIVSPETSISRTGGGGGTERLGQTWIICWFSHSDPKSKKHLMNRLTTFYTRSTIFHCELFFARDQVVCSVDSNNPVYLMYPNPRFGNSKDYSSRNGRSWEGWWLMTNERQYGAIFDFCRREVGKPFDKSSVFLFPFVGCCVSAQSSESWLCSRLMTTAFISSGVLDPKIDPWSITPSGLRGLLNNEDLWTVRRSPLYYRN